MTLRDARTLGVVVAVGALAFSLVLGGAIPSGATPQTGIGSCTTIDEPGTYVLTKDIENGGKTRISQTCIKITADGVTFDGNGHLIDGRGVSHTKGIEVVGAKDVTIENVEIDDWHAGILVRDGAAAIHGVRTFSNAYGVRLENADGGEVTNNVIEDNLVGIWTDNVAATIQNNDFSENEISVRRDGGGASENDTPTTANATAAATAGVTTPAVA